MQTAVAQDSEFRPGFFILGAMKAGTTTLYRYLDERPDVCMARPKEPCFFERDFHLGLDHYRQTYFRHWRGEPVVGECRPANLYLPYVSERIHAANPEAKLVAVLRDPVERAYSEWQQWHAAGRERLGFAAAIRDNFRSLQDGRRLDTAEGRQMHCESLGFKQGSAGEVGFYRAYLDIGYYDEQISRYLRHFPADSMRFYLFDELARDPGSMVEDVCAFIGARPAGDAGQARARHENPAETKSYRAVRRACERSRLAALLPASLRRGCRSMLQRMTRDRGMDAETRLWLRRHYAPHVRALERLLGTDLSHWR